MNLSNLWITNHTARPFCLRKEFDLKKTPVHARVLSCGLGQFNLYINGRKVSDHILDPGWTDYDRCVQYVAYDVTDLLTKGRNAIGMEVGNGWYHMDLQPGHGYSFHFPPFMPPNPNPYHPYGNSLVAALEMTVTFQDGSTETIVTDESWKCAPSEVEYSNIYGSEKIVARDARTGFSEAGFDDREWILACRANKDEAPRGELIEQTQPAVRIIKTWKAEKIGSVNGRQIFDLGQNISGLLEVSLKGVAGEEIRFYPAEKLDQNGDADQMAKNWMLIDNVITYVPAGNGPESFCQKFTYFAGRYIAVEGNCEVLRMNGHAISSAWKEAGSFTCDDERYLRIYDMIERTVEANMLSVHTDCPTIERFAWQEPNHLMAPAIMYMKDGKKLWEKFLQDLRYAQHTGDDWFYDMAGGKFYPGDGLMPAQAPCYIPNVLPVPGMGSFYDIIPWGSTSILGTRWHYLFYGDLQIVKDNYEPGKRYLEHLKTKINEEGFLNHGLGDWGNPEQMLARENIETAFLYADAVTLAWFAGLLEQTADEEALLAFAETVKANYNRKLLVYDEKRGLQVYRVFDHPEEIVISQASQALPLYFGMVPEEARGDVTEAFRQALVEKDAFVCGEVGLPYVIQTAREAGFQDLICRFILKKEHPSYYAFILDGETTLGEYWENNPRSHCHDMMGHIIEWYYNGIAGIQPLAPGFSRVRIRPYLPESMNHVHCTYETPYGRISVEMAVKDGGVNLTVRVPEEVECTLDTSVLEKEGHLVTLL